MKDDPNVEDLLFRWFNNRHWKIKRTSILLLEATHKRMYGRMIGLFSEAGQMIAIYAPWNIERKHSYKKRQPLFNCAINSPDFFPLLDSFLKAHLKLHRKRISR
jgi:hypothetical protein